MMVRKTLLGIVLVRKIWCRGLLGRYQLILADGLISRDLFYTQSSDTRLRLRLAREVNTCPGQVPGVDVSLQELRVNQAAT